MFISTLNSKENPNEHKPVNKILFENDNSPINELSNDQNNDGPGLALLGQDIDAKEDRDVEDGGSSHPSRQQAERNPHHKHLNEAYLLRKDVKQGVHRAPKEQKHWDH